MFIDFLLEIFSKEEHETKEAIIWKDQVYTYTWLLNRIFFWREEIEKKKIAFGSVVAIEGDFSPNAVALLLALIERGCILIPLTKSVHAKEKKFLEIGQVEIIFSFGKEDEGHFKRLEVKADHELYQKLRERKHPGLVLFSSGTTGESKGAVHDVVPLLEKFKTARKSLRSITFLLFDHIGGVNTLFYLLSNRGCLVTVQKRTPDEVLGAIEKYRVQLLPTSPTFINLILLSEAYKRYDLDSLDLITYGTEPMPEGTLHQLHKIFPRVRLAQTYGLSEIGIVGSKSRSSQSLWMKIGGKGFQTRVKKGLLEVKAESAMLGYLNASSPFTEDGWFKTGDVVEMDGEYFRILGRKSEVIHVGGERVYPAEVESVIQELPDVLETFVYGEKHPTLGNIVCVKVRLAENIGEKEFKRLLKERCQSSLRAYQIPVKVFVVQEKMYGERFKKERFTKAHTIKN